MEKEGRLKYEFGGNNMDPDLNFISWIPEQDLIDSYLNMIRELYIQVIPAKAIYEMGLRRQMR